MDLYWNPIEEQAPLNGSSVELRRFLGCCPHRLIEGVQELGALGSFALPDPVGPAFARPLRHETAPRGVVASGAVPGPHRHAAVEPYHLGGGG